MTPLSNQEVISNQEMPEGHGSSSLHPSAQTTDSREFDPQGVTDSSQVQENQGQQNFHVFGVHVLNSRTTSVLDDIEKNISFGKQETIGLVGAQRLNKCFSDSKYHHTLQQMNRVYPEGMALRSASRILGCKVQDNITGIALFSQLCERLANSSEGIFLLGGDDGIARATAKKMMQRYPGLIISGCQHGNFKTNQEEAVINKINTSGAAVLLVDFGTPRQEVWLTENRDRLHAPVLMCVGGLFDAHAGSVKCVPAWLGKVGLEWARRALRAPVSNWLRHSIENSRFLYRVWRQKNKNGTIARPMKITPSEEANIIEHFGTLDQAAPLRRRITRVRQVYWQGLHVGAAAVKRMMDVIAAAILMILLAPLFLVVAVLIRSESPGPTFFTQMRVGERGSLLRLWKFRSMYMDAEERRAELDATNEMTGGVTFKIKNDPRITRIGYYIRKFSIDELPQLWNVFTGDMSLVGPRPAIESEVELYTIEERVRLLAKPGLTCIWQVSGRSEIPFSQQVVLDEDYLYRQSLATDIKLLFRTIPAVLRGKGAY